MMTMALCITLTGLIGLLVLDMSVALSNQPINDALKTGGDVSISGAIKSLKIGKSSVILTILDESGEIEAILFDKHINLKKGDLVKVEGKISEYMGKKQLEIRKIIPE